MWETSIDADIGGRRLANSDLVYGSLAEASCAGGILWTAERGQVSGLEAGVGAAVDGGFGCPTNEAPVSGSFRPAVGLLPEFLPATVPATARWWSVVGGVGVPLPGQTEQSPYANVSERELIIVKKSRPEQPGQGWPANSGEASVVYECRLCGRQCKWRSSISVHVRTHTGRKPYSCRICQQSFADSSTRKKHEKKTHGCVIPGNKRTDRLPEVRTQKREFQQSQQQQQQQQKQQQQQQQHQQRQQLVLRHEQQQQQQQQQQQHSRDCNSQEGLPDSGQLAESGDCGLFIWTEEMEQQQQQQQQQKQQECGIPLPSAPDVGKFLSSSLLDTSGACWEEFDTDVGLLLAQPDKLGDCSDGSDTNVDGDSISQYVLTDSAGLEEILQEAKLSSYNQHLEFHKLEW